MPRVPDHSIDQRFIERWSPRAMSGQPVPLEDLMRLFEAARWAPSAGNGQPWRFVYAIAKTSSFDRHLAVLDEGNREWCGRAGALVLIASNTLSKRGQPLRSHAFDAGAAWMSLALQGSAMGLVVHAMGGLDYHRARSELAVPQDHEVMCMVAIGHPGQVRELPERLREREAPNSREPVGSFVLEGRFPA